MRILIHHDGALGDVLLSLPCLKKIRSDASRVVIAGRRNVVHFLKEAGIVDACVSSDRAFLAPLYAEPDAGLRNFLAGFDRACIFTACPGSPAAEALRACIPRTQIIGTIPPADARIHAAEYRLAQLVPGARPSAWSSPLDIAVEHTARARTLLKEAGFQGRRILTGIHPGSGGRSKCWPLERYFELIERMQCAFDPFIIIFSGSAEDGRMRKRIDRFALSRSNVLHAADFRLMTAAALLKECDLYIGNDSGFSHLAGASGRPSLVLFGPTDPACWKPSGERIRVISQESGSLEHLTVDRVFESVRAMQVRI